MDPNKALFETYKKYWPSLQIALNQIASKKGIDIVQLKISYPLLIHVFPEYQKTKTKLMIVGQQTRGWGWKNITKFWGTSKWDDSVEELIEELIKKYKGFHLGEKYYSTPFWHSAHKLFQKIEPSGPEYGFLWSNLIKIDQKGKDPKDFIKETVCNSFPVLPLEIEVTRPDVAVFLTGPYYDKIIRQTFNGLNFDKIEGYKERTLARIVHYRLPKDSFRTYHPNYFIRSGKSHELDKVFNKIAELVKN